MSTKTHTYSELSDALTKACRDYAKSKTDEDDAVRSENNISHIIALRGLIRNTAKTVDAAIEICCGSASVALEECAVFFDEKGLRYDIAVVPKHIDPEFVGKRVSRSIRIECGYKCKWSSRRDGNISISIKK